MSPVFWLFLLSGFLLAVTPGPAVLYLVARSVDQGRRAGLVSCLGVFSATLVHVTAAVLGLAAVMASSPWLLSLVRYAGAGYLGWLGVATFLRQDEPDTQVLEKATLGRVWRDGFLVNLLNPKTTLFFLAFLPQFVDPALGNPSGQVLVLGLSFAVLAFGTDSLWALVAGTLGQAVRHRPRIRRRMRTLSGVLYLALGVFAAFFTGKG